MNQQEFVRLRSLFSTLVELEPELRDEFILRTAGESTERALRRLLHADDALASMTAQRAVRLTGVGLERREAAAPEFIGGFRIERELGRGGMGAVYLATRAVPGGVQRIAVKSLHPIGAVQEFERRFHAEISALARLSHPHIARLVDAGREADGRCWIAMEFVEGLPLLQYCDTHRLTVDARLKLFDTLCEAVSAAHRSLIVHRDIKSSNVLVRDDGELFLIDFGIARALSAAADTTQADRRFLSPLSSAPEQFLGEPTTTACDVYGLGVLLYELLAGVQPISPDVARGELMLEAVLNQVPPLASARVRQLARSEPERALLVAQARSATGAAHLADALQGDLELICAVALRKQPAERYASVDQLRDDISRARHGLPLRVRGNDRWYRTSRWVRRHAIAVSLGLFAAFALTLGVVLLWLQANALERERDHARAQTVRAQQQGERAEFLNAFLLGAFEQADPSHKMGASLTAQQILQAGIRRLNTTEGDAESRVRIGLTLADVSHRLGMYDELAALAAETRRELEQLSAPPPRLLAQQHYIESRRLFHENDYKSARAEVDAGLALLGKPDDAPGQRLWVALTEVSADVWTMLDKKLARRAAYRELVAVASTMKGLSPVDVWDARLRLAKDLNLDTDTRPEARTIVEALLREQDAAGTERTYIRAKTFETMAMIEHRSGHDHVAHEMAQQAFQMTRDIYGEDHLMTALALNVLANAEGADLAPRLAIEHHERAAKVFARYGMTKTMSFGMLYNIAGQYADHLKDYVQAERFYREALRGWSDLLGTNNTNVVIVETALASVLIEQGRCDEAEPLVRHSLEFWQQNDGNEEDISQLQVQLANVRHGQRRDKEATELLRRWLPIFRKHAVADNYILFRAETVASKLHVF